MARLNKTDFNNASLHKMRGDKPPALSFRCLSIALALNVLSFYISNFSVVLDLAPIAFIGDQFRCITAGQNPQLLRRLTGCRPDVDVRLCLDLTDRSLSRRVFLYSQEIRPNKSFLAFVIYLGLTVYPLLQHLPLAAFRRLTQLVGFFTVRTSDIDCI